MEIDELPANENTRVRYADPSRFVFPVNEGFEEFTPVNRPVAEYFYLVFPMIFISPILIWTNEVLASSNYPVNVRVPVTKGEFIRWIGIRLCMVITPLRGGLDSYFATEAAEGSVYEPGNYGKRFKMSKNRFKAIQESLRFGPPESADGDPWWPIREFINAFNKRMQVVLLPGCFLCIDESMSMWKGMCSKIAGIFGLPHKTKIMRKPEGVGAEMKSLADCRTGCMMMIDLMEGMERNAVKEFNNLGAGAGTTLRLSKAYHGSNRVVVGDSWFASLMTAWELFKVGIFFMGIVKTASRCFPKKYLTEWCDANNARENRGKCKLLKTTKDDCNIYALGWSDKKGKHVVFTTGTTLEAEPSRRKRHRSVLRDGVWVKQRYEKVVKRPAIVKELFDAFSAIDVHDHLRQGLLEIERQWITRDWVLRLFGTVLGIIIVNAFNAYLYMDPGGLDFNTFLGNLAYQLIFNKFFTANERVLRPRAEDDAEEDEVEQCESGKLIDHPHYADKRGTSKRAKLMCNAVECSHQTAYYCKPCSAKAGRFISFCFGTRSCFISHVNHKN